MPILQQLTPEQFRKQLAGLTDVRDSGVLSSEGMREHGTNLAVAMAVAFNRRKLDVKTLWTRIDSAIQAGITAANGADIHALIDATCGHVLASPNAVVSDEFAALIGPLFDLDDDEAYALVKYLSRSRYTVIVFAKRAWEERKELRAAANRITEEQVAHAEPEVSE